MVPARRSRFAPFIAVAALLAALGCGPAPRSSGGGPVRGKTLVPTTGGLAPTPTAAVAAAESRHALIIGVSRYKDTRVVPLQFAATDANAIWARAIDEDGLHVPAENTRLLLDQDATRSAILAGLEWLNQVSHGGDTAIVYFSGHGAVDVQPSGAIGGHYLLPYDARPLDRKGDLALDPRTGISLALLRETLQNSRAKQLLLVLDCCFAGGVEGNFSQVRLDRDQMRQSLAEIDSFQYLGTGRWTITACSPNEPALEADSLGHGVFTYYFLEGLERDPDHDGHVTFDEVFKYVHPNVQAFARKNGHEQEPRQYVAGTVLVLRDVPRSSHRVGLTVRYGASSFSGESTPPSRPEAAPGAAAYEVAVDTREDPTPLHVAVLRVARLPSGEVRCARLVPDGEDALAPPVTAAPGSAAGARYPDPALTGLTRAIVPASERAAEVVFLLIATDEEIDAAILDGLVKSLEAPPDAAAPPELARRVARTVDAESALGSATLKYLYLRHGP
jgi:uncharacterized caspase-like protein